jgi:hypothetical protein
MPVRLEYFDPERAIKRFNNESSELGGPLAALIDRSYEHENRHFNVNELPYEFVVVVDNNTGDIVMARYERTIHVYMGSAFTLDDDLEGVEAVISDQFSLSEWSVVRSPENPSVDELDRNDTEALYSEVAPLFNEISGYRFQVPLTDIDRDALGET